MNGDYHIWLQLTVQCNIIYFIHLLISFNVYLYIIIYYYFIICLFIYLSYFIYLFIFWGGGGGTHDDMERTSYLIKENTKGQHCGSFVGENPLVSDVFPSQRASIAENVSIRSSCMVLLNGCDLTNTYWKYLAGTLSIFVFDILRNVWVFFIRQSIKSGRNELTISGIPQKCCMFTPGSPFTNMV